MEHMQDKEFDQFFKDKMAEAEVAPPAMLWAKVDAQLAPSAKKRFPMLWMAAAVAVIAVSAALLFNQQEKIQLQGQPVVVTTTEKPVLETTPEAAVTPAPGQEKQQAPFSPIGEGQTAPLSQVVSTPVKTPAKKELLAMQPSGQQQHLDHSDQDVKQPQMGTTVVPAIELALTTPQEPIMAGIEETPQQDALADEFDALPQRKGINNVGDLVNFVVDKIDKREEKILKFNPNDDDQSSLVSINIGILKFNTKQKEKR